LFKNITTGKIMFLDWDYQLVNTELDPDDLPFIDTLPRITQRDAEGWQVEIGERE